MNEYLEGFLFLSIIIGAWTICWFGGKWQAEWEIRKEKQNKDSTNET